MGTLGIQPPQFKIPGNLKNLPKGLSSTLDPNKLKQLSPAQLDAIKNLPPEKLATLNTLPIDQIKNLDPKQLADKVSKLPNSDVIKDQKSKLKNAVKDREQRLKEKKDRIEQAVNDPKSFLENQSKLNTKDIKNQIISIVTPVLLSFVRTENIADILIKKLTKDTKKQLQNKGTLTIVNGVFTFTPSKSGDYITFKSNFDKRVSNLKKSITTLESILNTLNKILKILNLALSGIKIYIKIKTKLRMVKLTKISVELATPSPGGVKPTVGIDLINVVTNIDNLNNANKKIDTYQSAITAVTAFTTVFKDMVTKLKIKINQLQFVILSSDTTTDLNSQLEQSKISVPDTEDYTSADGKSYILKLIILPNEQRQYQALDSFSKMKITQTAPSRIKTNAQLLEEIKQILG